jgi:hypothetical protein
MSARETVRISALPDDRPDSRTTTKTMIRSVQTLLAVLACALVYAAPACADEAANAESQDGMELHVMGFGDISYISNDASDQDGFAIGQAVAHVAASLDDSLSIFGEFSATARDSEYSIEVERLIVKYDFSDRYKLSAGRYHTPIGYWNSAFHHGAWLQTTSTRPEVFKFGSRIVPIHFVGVLLEGTLTGGDLGLGYKAGFGNGRHANIARAGDAGDINGDKAWMLQVTAKPQNLYGLDAGIGYYSDEVSPTGLPPTSEKTVSAYLAWTRETPEFIVEYLHSEHALLTDSSVSGDVNAWYAQLAYRLPGERSNWKPYARVEQTSVDDSDPLLGADGLDYEGAILGVRWDFNPHAALKAEYRNEEFDSNGRENNFRVQLSFVLSRL